jgi:hypothetical protein
MFCVAGVCFLFIMIEVVDTWTRMVCHIYTRHSTCQSKPVNKADHFPQDIVEYI